MAFFFSASDALGRPIRLFLTEVNVGDCNGARALLAFLPDAKWMLADRGHDADCYRNGLKQRNTESCIPSRRHHKDLFSHNSMIYQAIHKIGNMFGRLKDRRWVATR